MNRYESRGGFSFLRRPSPRLVGILDLGLMNSIKIKQDDSIDKQLTHMCLHQSVEGTIHV